MTLQLDGQLDLLDLLPPTCVCCGAVADPGHPYDVHRFPKQHSEVEAGVCKEMAWARRGYQQAMWAVENFGSWFHLASPGSERYREQLRAMEEERDRFEARCAIYTARVGTDWMRTSINERSA